MIGKLIVHAKNRDRAIKLIDEINWENGFFRKDIGFKIIDK